MVPGQVLTAETIDFMRKLDVKEIHGYEADKGLKLIRPDKLGAPSADQDGQCLREKGTHIMASFFE